MAQQPLSVLVASGEGQDFFHLLDDVAGVTVKRCTPPEVMDHCAEIDVFYGRPSADILAAAPKLRWIQAPSAGVEFVATIPELVESDIVLTNTSGAHGPSIGEHTFALLLALTRHIPESVDQQRRHHWDRSALYRTAREVGGMTMGIIGFGALGRGIAQRAGAFEIDLLAVDAQALDGDPYLDEVWPVSRLEELLAASDVVVVSAPLTSETHHLLNAERLALMKPDAYVIAVSRGGIIDEAALVAALSAGKLAGAALDVTEKEPLPADSPLWDTPNLLLTPHLAGASAPKERRVVEIFRDNLERFVNGDPLVNVVDKRRGY
jgi:phosphoglycerate dehydrogenase-like enzyme